MSQRANLELVENLKPWIYKAIRDYLAVDDGGGGGEDCFCEQGDNILIQAGVISLDANVVIGQELTIEQGSRLVLWDNQLEKFFDIYIENGYIWAQQSSYTPPAIKLPGSGCTSGRNITTAGGVVSLDADVIIDNSISFPINTGLRIWDAALEEYLYLTIDDEHMQMVPTGQQPGGPIFPPDESQCLSGDNIDVVLNVVNLSDYVVIRNTLAIPNNSSLRMWDSTRDAYGKIYMEGGYMKVSY